MEDDLEELGPWSFEIALQERVNLEADVRWARKPDPGVPGIPRPRPWEVRKEKRVPLRKRLIACIP